MKYPSLFSVVLRPLWTGAVAVFVVAEADVLIKFWRIPGDRLLWGQGTKFYIAFIVALPMVAGMRGFYSVRRRLPSAGDDVITAISLQFLLTIVIAYSALLVCMGEMSMGLQRF